MREPLTLGGVKISIRPNFCAAVRNTNTKDFSRAMILLKQIAQTYREVFPESFLILVDLNNWFYAVMKIFP